MLGSELHAVNNPNSPPNSPEGSEKKHIMSGGRAKYEGNALYIFMEKVDYIYIYIYIYITYITHLITNFLVGWSRLSSEVQREDMYVCIYISLSLSLSVCVCVCVYVCIYRYQEAR